MLNVQNGRIVENVEVYSRYPLVSWGFEEVYSCSFHHFLLKTVIIPSHSQLETQVKPHWSVKRFAQQ